MAASFRKANRSSKRRRFLVSLLVLFVGSVCLASAASAHHPDISGSSNCDGSISFTSTAWLGANDAERTNPSIEIAYAVDGGSYTLLPANGAYRYDSGNDFTFSDSFTPPSGWSSLTLRATATGTWGSGVAPGDSRTTGSITPQADCEPATVPAATIADATCDDEGALVHLTNDGTSPVDFTITSGETTQTVTVPGGSSEDIIVPLEGDATTIVTVVAEGMDDVTRSVTYHCASAQPQSSTPAATCVDGGAVVHLSNAGDAPAVFTISVPGQEDVVTSVPAGGTADVLVSTTEGLSTPITVSAPGMASVTENVTYACASGTDTVALPGDETAGGGPVGGGPTADADAQPPAPLSELPRTGSASLVLLFVAFMSITVGAAALHWSGRLRGAEGRPGRRVGRRILGGAGGSMLRSIARLPAHGAAGGANAVRALWVNLTGIRPNLVSWGASPSRSAHLLMLLGVLLASASVAVRRRTRRRSSFMAGGRTTRISFS